MKIIKCNNCYLDFNVGGPSVKRYPDIPDLLARIAPGEEVPEAECPNCGALVHEKWLWEINTELVLSTTHITASDNEVLGGALRQLIVDDCEYGYRIYVAAGGRKADPDEVFKAEMLAEGLSEACAQLLILARTLCCKWLVLDCDGPVMESLPQFEW